MVGIWFFARKPASFLRRRELPRAVILAYTGERCEANAGSTDCRRHPSWNAGRFHWGGNPSLSHLSVRAKRLITRTLGELFATFCRPIPGAMALGLGTVAREQWAILGSNQ
jgi:hypothetical protein